MSRSEAYHLLIGLIACAAWFFGKKWGLEADAVQFAAITTTAVVGHAIGLTNSGSIADPVPNVPASTPEAPVAVAPVATK